MSRVGFSPFRICDGEDPEDRPSGLSRLSFNLKHMRYKDRLVLTSMKDSFPRLQQFNAVAQNSKAAAHLSQVAAG